MMTGTISQALPATSEPPAHIQEDDAPETYGADADADANENENVDGDEEDEEVTRWDEGGKSDCGYGDGLHDTLMAIGASVHGMVGEPSETIQGAMNQIGNWFQEASYAARDLKQGKMNVGEETMKAVQSVVSGDEGDNGNNADGAGDAGDEQPADQLETIEEKSGA